MGKSKIFEGTMGEGFAKFDDGVTLYARCVAHVPVGNRVRVTVEDIGAPIREPQSAGEACFAAYFNGSSKWLDRSDGERGAWDAAAEAAFKWVMSNIERKMAERRRDSDNGEL